MALLHRASLTPSKLELIHDWVPAQPWYEGDPVPALEARGAYRFDDPDGEVGIETLLIGAADGPTLQVPLTYRAAPLDSAAAHLIGTMNHSVLGERWVYDGCGDPVYATMLARTILTGGRQADQVREVDGRLETVEPTALVHGSGQETDTGPITVRSCEHLGHTTVLSATPYDIVVRRVLDDEPAEAGPALTGTWTGRETPVLLAFAREGA